MALKRFVSLVGVLGVEENTKCVCCVRVQQSRSISLGQNDHFTSLVLWHIFFIVPCRLGLHKRLLIIISAIAQCPLFSGIKREM